MRTLLVLALALVAAAPALAAPPPAEDSHRTAARDFYKTGTLLYDRGKFIDAAAEFEHAYGEQPLPAFLYNIASAYDKGGDRARAAQAYRRYAAAAPKAPDKDAALARAAVLEREAKEIAAVKTEARAPRALPPSLPYVEPVTHHSFMTRVAYDGVPYTMLGAGARKVFFFKVYAMALYVEDAPARAAFPRLAAEAGGSDHDTLVRGDLVYQFVVLGDFGKSAVLHFCRAVSAKETRKAYRDALGEDGGSQAPEELREAVDSFLALFDDVKSGDDVTIRTRRDGQVVVETHGKSTVGPTNLRLAHDIWAIWLGSHPISSDLKKSIVDRIDTLGR